MIMKTKKECCTEEVVAVVHSIHACVGYVALLRLSQVGYVYSMSSSTSTCSCARLGLYIMITDGTLRSWDSVNAI